MNQDIQKALTQITLPAASSHKGQNGKLLVIGGSDLFHAASKWSLDVASKIVDMVFYSSVVSNNELIAQAKGEFWNGIVVPRGEVESYLGEADCVLIGPGMERAERTSQTQTQVQTQTTPQFWSKPLTPTEWETNTERIINYLLITYPTKKWVIDAGALQMVEPSLLTSSCVLTPHPAELQRLLERTTKELLLAQGATLLITGQSDTVISPELEITIEGGNSGMTKGGTGDVLAGLVAALYCTHDAHTSAVVGSYINKKAGEALAETVGPYFNASDLARQVPKTLWHALSSL